MSFVGPLTLAPIAERLRGVTELRGVEGVADMESAVQAGGPKQSPWAYVLPGREDARPSTGTTEALIQSVNTLVGVVICARNLRQAGTAEAATADIQPVIQVVRTRLLGWRHPAARTAFDFHSGRVLQHTAGLIWWQEIYRTDYRIEVRP